MFLCNFRAHASARVQATSMAMGRGTAAVAAMNDIKPSLVPVEAQKKLMKNGAILEPGLPSRNLNFNYQIRFFFGLLISLMRSFKMTIETLNNTIINLIIMSSE